MNTYSVRFERAPVQQGPETLLATLGWSSTGTARHRCSLVGCMLCGAERAGRGWREHTHVAVVEGNG
jgi:hypothetical protein